VGRGAREGGREGNELEMYEGTHELLDKITYNQAYHSHQVKETSVGLLLRRGRRRGRGRGEGNDNKTRKIDEYYLYICLARLRLQLFVVVVVVVVVVVRGFFLRVLSCFSFSDFLFLVCGQLDFSRCC